jgi:3-oxoacyl-[acyl-carrier protein] reductase
LELDLSNKVALVTGGGTGIGKSTCLRLAKLGATVAINYSRSKVEAQETALLIKNEGGRTVVIKADITRDSEVREMVDNIVEQFGNIDILVNNAGITRHIPLDDLEAITDDVWDDVYAVNVKGMFHCIRAVAPFMKKNKQGAIVNVGSICALSGSGSSIPYVASKASIHSLTKSLARVLAPEIKVNCVAPGTVETRWWAGKEEKMKATIPKILLKRVCSPDDVAMLICSILEQEGMTGQIVTIDNGQTL